MSTEQGEEDTFIEFDANGKINGNTSVNVFNGEYKLEGENLTLSNIGMTRMMGASMDVEGAVTEALNHTATVKAEGEKILVFNDKKDTVMVLTKWTEKEKEPICGGYSEFRELTKEDIALFEKTYQGDMKLTPQSVSTQIVAGTNYKFQCVDQDNKQVQVVIFLPLPGEGDPVVSCVN